MQLLMTPLTIGSEAMGCRTRIGEEANHIYFGIIPSYRLCFDSLHSDVFCLNVEIVSLSFGQRK
jgi:hypothetical protein